MNLINSFKACEFSNSCDKQCIAKEENHYESVFCPARLERLNSIKEES